MMGVLGNLITFPFLFMPAIGISRPEGCMEDEECNANILMTIYYSVLAVIYNFFWATVEISHLAMIPGIASSANERGALSMIRNVAFVLSNIVMYGILWVMLRAGKSLDAFPSFLSK